MAELSEYEKERKARVGQNQKFLAALGLQETANSLAEDVSASNPNSEQNLKLKKERKRLIYLSGGPARRSKRIQRSRFSENPNSQNHKFVKKNENSEAFETFGTFGKDVFGEREGGEEEEEEYDPPSEGGEGESESEVGVGVREGEEEREEGEEGQGEGEGGGEGKKRKGRLRLKRKSQVGFRERGVFWETEIEDIKSFVVKGKGKSEREEDDEEEYEPLSEEGEEESEGGEGDGEGDDEEEEEEKEGIFQSKKKNQVSKKRQNSFRDDGRTASHGNRSSVLIPPTDMDMDDEELAIQKAVALSLGLPPPPSLPPSSLTQQTNEKVPTSEKDKVQKRTKKKDKKGDNISPPKVPKPTKKKTNLVTLSQEDVETLFFFFDERGRGGISVLDIVRVASSHEIEWTGEEVEDMVQFFDSNSDGKLSLEDFQQIVKRSGLCSN